MITIKDTNVTIMVKDLDKAIHFYKSIGFELKQRWENHYAQVAAMNIIIGLHPTTEDIPSSSKISIGFMVDSIDEAKALLDSSKTHYKSEDGKSGSYLHFHDPDGTFLYFTQPKWS